MINLPKHNRHMRDKLNIPSNAVVFGGYGGSDNFSINCAQKAVFNVAKNNPNIYFLFANFKKFCPECLGYYNLLYYLNSLLYY